VNESAKSALSIECLSTILTSTPEHHSVYEHQELVEPPKVSATFCMPWDNPDEYEALDLLEPLSSDLFLERYVKRTREQCKQECEYPQRSDGWHKARAFSITASQFGSAVGHNKYLSRPGLLRSKIHPHLHTVTSSYAEWGVQHEVHAEEAFRLFLESRCDGLFSLDHPNLLKHEDAPWVACSPDAILRRRDNGDVTELVEYKAPAFHRNKVGHPYDKEAYNIPRQYMDQIQGTMWLMRNYDVVTGGRSVERCWFVVWQPHALYVTHIPYLEVYANRLMASVKDFFMKDFIDGCVEEVQKVKNRCKK